MPTPAERLGALRDVLRAETLDGVVVPRADEHLGENAPPSSERLAWLTGFTGSAGTAIVLVDRAAIFSDGRYVLQLAAQTDPALWEPLHNGDHPPEHWLRARARDSGRRLAIGYDPKLVAESEIARFAGSGIELRPLDRNPIDTIWHDRPAPPRAAAYALPETLTGRSGAAKRDAVAAVLRADGEHAAVLTDPTSIAWLLNIRGGDLEFEPVALGFAVIADDGAVELFMDGAKLDDDTRAALGNGVSVADPATMPRRLAQFAGRRVRVDRGHAPAWFAQALRDGGADVVAAADPCLALKARKTDAEIEASRRAHRADGVALTRFLHWLAAEATIGRDTERSASARLLAFRREFSGFRGESFAAISGAGEHGAIMHYRVTEASDRVLGARELYLIDSGGQYDGATTDVTRTVWTGGGTMPDGWRAQFTHVLQGMIGLATLTFPAGIPGFRLDAIARAALWRAGLDFDHGTGHGIGAQLGVHEGPMTIGTKGNNEAPIEAGQILSDEPGFYEPGSHGIRIENLLLVRAVEIGRQKPFLGFETLTLAPIDRHCIDAALLAPAERAWLDAYHERVRTEIGPLVPEATRQWLAEACAPL